MLDQLITGRVGSVYCSDRKQVPTDNLTCCYQQTHVIATSEEVGMGSNKRGGEESVRVEMRLGAAACSPVELT